MPLTKLDFRRDDKRLLSSWPPSDEAVLRRGYLNGTPVKEIARKTGRSVGQVTGRARNLGLKHPNGLVREAVQRRKQVVSEQRRLLRSHQASHLSQRPTIPIGMSLPLPEGPPIRHAACQWIAGKPAADDACKCGEPTAAGAPYCSGHQARSRVKGTGL